MRGICGNCETPITYDELTGRWWHDAGHDVLTTVGEHTFWWPCETLIPRAVTRV